MAKVLVQQSHDVRLTDVLSAIEERALEPVVIADPMLGEAIERHCREIAGFVLFQPTEHAFRAAALLLDERFGTPTLPMVYLGPIGSSTRLPYGVSPVDGTSPSELIEPLASPRSIRVLVVEDDDGIRDVLRLSLSRSFEVQTAADGAEALEHLSDTAYDAVVLDVMLPRVGGDEVFRQLQATHPDTAVLIITAHDTESRELDYVFGGADGYLAKPFDSNRVFRQKVVDALCHHHERAVAALHPRQAEEENDAWETYRHRMQAHV